MSKSNEQLNKIASVIAKILEVFHWVALGLLIACLISYLIDEKLIKYFMDTEDGVFTLPGYSINVLNDGGEIISAAYIAALVLAIFVYGLMAMIFRNIYLIFKTTAGKTKFSKGATPFQPDNVRMLREIGIFAISISIVEIICNIVVAIILDNVSTDLSFAGILFGIALLCLSQFFAYGVQLQSDSDGLL